MSKLKIRRKRETLDKLRGMGMVFGPEYDVLTNTLEASRKVEADNAKITKIDYIKDTQKKDGNQHFIVKVTVSSEQFQNIVEVEIDGRIFIATRKSTVFELNAFYANVFVDFSNILLVNQDFKLIARLKQNLTRMLLDMKSTNLKVDLKSNVTDLDKIKIVIDPGHGYTKGNTGAVCHIYTHKIKGKDGKPILDIKGDYKTETNNIIKLPEYVTNEPDEWIISKKEDPNHNERILVYDISAKLKELLEANNFTCFITRKSRVVTGNDDETSRKARIDLANSNNADYFISIHADGSDDNTSTGAHVIYPKTKDATILENCKTLATDIFKNYNVINIDKDSPKEDVRGLQVLGSSNLTKRKVLVELGFVTTAKDAKLLFTNIDRIANQLFEGIKINIKSFKR